MISNLKEKKVQIIKRSNELITFVFIEQVLTFICPLSQEKMTSVIYYYLTFYQCVIMFKKNYPSKIIFSYEYVDEKKLCRTTK